MLIRFAEIVASMVHSTLLLIRILLYGSTTNYLVVLLQGIEAISRFGLLWVPLLTLKVRKLQQKQDTQLPLIECLVYGRYLTLC